MSRLLGPDGNPAGWRLVGNVTVRCSAAGTVTLTATAGTGNAQITRTAPVSIDCAEQGRIIGLDDTEVMSADTGTVPVADTFTVTPADAPCTATATAGTAVVDDVVPEGQAGNRIVSVGLTAAAGANGSAAVTVDCTPPGHAPVVETATFAAVWTDRCDDPLGTLGGHVFGGTTVTRSGAITSDRRCVSGASNLWGQ